MTFETLKELKSIVPKIVNRKKIIILLLILFTAISTFSQTCDTIKHFFHSLPANVPKQINCRDSLGNKIGWWIEYSLREWQYETSLGKIEKGQSVVYYGYGLYKENKKINKWDYFNSYSDVTLKDKEEFYYQDGSVTEIKYEKTNIITNFNLDSSIVNSKVIVSQDTIYIDCQNRNCVAKFNNDNIIEFPLNDLDIQQFAFLLGVYNRKIKIIKYNSKQQEQ